MRLQASTGRNDNRFVVVIVIFFLVFVASDPSIGLTRTYSLDVGDNPLRQPPSRPQCMVSSIGSTRRFIARVISRRRRERGHCFRRFRRCAYSRRRRRASAQLQALGSHRCRQNASLSIGHTRPTRSSERT